MMASGFSSISNRRLPSMNVDARHRKIVPEAFIYSELDTCVYCQGAEVDTNAWEVLAPPMTATAQILLVDFDLIHAQIFFNTPLVLDSDLRAAEWDRAGDVARGDWLAGFSWAQVTWQWISRITLTFGLVLSTDRPACR
uniref:Uncharacterized protein n=1 Tax=Oryza meridionalis TaxID=40149 RepID=A0A0E0CT42_9ORYZ